MVCEAEEIVFITLLQNPCLINVGYLAKIVACIQAIVTEKI